MKTVGRAGQSFGGMIALLLARGAYAQGFTAPQNPGLPVTDLPTGLANIINTVLLLVGVIALGFIVWGGFKYIYARGDEREIESAKGTIVTAVIGIVVIGIAAAIINFVIGAVV